MKDKDRPSRIAGWLNGAVYVLFAVLAAAIVIFMNFEAGVLLEFFLVFVAALIAMTLWLKRQLSTLPETGEEVQLAGAEAAALLERSESRFRRIYESNMMGIAFCRESGEITDANDAFLDMVSYTRQELEAGKVNWLEMTPPEQLHLSRRGIEEAKAKGYVAPFEKEYIRKDGQRVQILIGGALLEGEDVGVAYAIDITERKQAEKILKESEERIRLLFETMPHAVYECDTAGVITVANSAYSRITGCSKDELVGMHVWDMMEEGEQKESLPAYLRQLVAEQPEPSPYICRNVTKDGRLADVEVNWDYKCDEGGQVTGFVCILSDITERKKTEEALRVSEERFRRAVTEAPFPIMIHADDGEVLQINKVWTELTGYEPEEIPTLSAWTQRAYGERKDVVKSRIDKIFNYHTRVEEGEYVISSRDGRALTWDFSSAPLGRLPDGRRLVISIAMDVTDRKKAEVALRESEELHRVTLGSISDAVFITDKVGDFTFICPNVDVIFGCSFKEAQALGNISKLLGEDVFVPADMESRGEICNIERKITDKNGKCHYLLVNVKQVSIKRGTHLYTCHDITDLHEAEAALYWESSVNKALAHLSNVLNKPHFSFEEISDFVLAYAKRMTGSKFGFAGYVDEQTGYLVCPTLTKDVWKQCNVQGKDIVFKKCGGLCGRVLNERESVLVNSPADDPRVAGTPQGHIPIERFIGVPSLTGDEVIGMVAVANSETDYVERDRWLVERLAEIYALAIQSNQSQRRLEKHDSQLRDLVSSLGLAQERRARRLAAGLHEEIIDRLNSARESMASLDKLEGKDPGVDSMPRVREALSDLVKITHAFASGLSCPVLRQSGLAAAVESWLAEDIRKKHGIETVFEKDDNCRVADEDVEYFLFEAIKELLANTVEHARATRVKVSLKRSGDDVAVAVADDGVGFDTAGTRLKPGEGIEYNLFCIGERLRHLGGGMEIDSRLGEGTRVVLTVPAGSGVRK